MHDDRHVTAFRGDRWFAAGTTSEVAQAMRAAVPPGDDGTILVFDDETGAQVDVALHAVPAGREDDVRKAGRPRLGVVAREITLLPRHWDWLNLQPGGPSATLRRLVDGARKAEGGGAGQARQAADRFMAAALGNAPGYEEVSRALYRGERSRFLALTEPWPADLRDYARRLASPGLPEEQG